MYLHIFNPVRIEIGRIEEGGGGYTSSRNITIETDEGETLSITIHGKVENLENITLPPIEEIEIKDLPEALRRQAD